MNLLDFFIILIVLGYAVSGYIQGFVTGLVATIGLLIGGGLAVYLTPIIFDSRSPTAMTALFAVVGVLISALIGQAIGTHMGAGIRDGVKWRPARWLDSLAGGVLGVVAVLAVSWAMGYAVSGTQVPYLSQSVRESVVLGEVDKVMPDAADNALNAFNQVLDTNMFPRYLDPFESENIIAVEPPDEATLGLPAVQEASKSVVKILGAAVCNRGIEGSAFVYAQDRVMTNAHVVAGVRRPFVVVGERRLPAEVVVYDPKLDIAVLAVNGLGLEPLEFDTTGKAGDDAAVLGYPENGPFDARAARIRQVQSLRSPDIYNRDQVVREAFSIRSLIRSGNSGGPLISDQGDVYGVIFAASVSDQSTGYAVTASQVALNAEAGRRAGTPVDTGGCA